MKSIYFFALIIALPAIQAQEDFDTFVPPEKPRINIYRSLWEQSPFTEKEIAPPPEEGPGFAENLELEGIMSLGGEDVACLVDTSTEEVLYVRASEATNGITLVEVRNRDKIDQASVILASGSQRSTLEFSDEKLVVGPSAGAAQKVLPKEQNNTNVNPQANAQPQQTANKTETTSLTEDQMRERRRQFWESMRDRRSRDK